MVVALMGKFENILGILRKRLAGNVLERTVKMRENFEVICPDFPGCTPYDVFLRLETRRKIGSTSLLPKVVFDVS